MIEEQDTLRAVCKIQTLSDGGYALLAPYHTAREGWLAKYQVDYSQTDMEHRLSDMQHFSAGDRVKLSHHFDGFVQFSGENTGRIRSGRDPITGKPKGLAIMSAPIVRPIRTGPTFGATVWGLDQFKPVEATRGSDAVFESHEMYYRTCTPRSFNGYHIEGWIFHPNMWAGVRGNENDLRLSMGFRNFEGSGANLEFRVFPLAKYDYFVGLMVSKIQLSFTQHSGFQLTGPSDRRKGSNLANTLMAFYPRLDGMQFAEPLDYVRDEPAT